MNIVCSTCNGKGKVRCSHCYCESDYCIHCFGSGEEKCPMCCNTDISINKNNSISKVKTKDSEAMPVNVNNDETESNSKFFTLKDYIGNDEYIKYLNEEYSYIVESLANKKYSKLIATSISKWYQKLRNGYYDQIYRKKQANKLIKSLYNKIENISERNENEISDYIQTHITEFEKERSIRRYEKVEQERHKWAKDEYSLPIHQKKEIKNMLKRLKNMLEEQKKLLFDDNYAVKFVASDIDKCTIDELTWILAEYMSNLRYGYDLSSLRSKSHWWDSEDFSYWEERELKVGYIYIATNKYMPSLVKIGKTERYPYDRVDELSSATGVPGKFIIEYTRKTVIDFPIYSTKSKSFIEKTIHKHLRDKLLDEDVCVTENIELNNTEFFVVPSVKYAILFVDEYLDKLKRIL